MRPPLLNQSSPKRTISGNLLCCLSNRQSGLNVNLKLKVLPLLVFWLSLCQLVSINNQLEWVDASPATAADLKKHNSNQVKKNGTQLTLNLDEFKNKTELLELLNLLKHKHASPITAAILEQANQHQNTKSPHKNVSQSTSAPESSQHNKKHIKLDKNKESYTPEELDSILKMDGIECGRVPIFEKSVRRSINESFNMHPNDDEAGEFRILHGLDSIVGEWPWIVRIQFCKEEDDCAECTGTLLNDRWVITAGHCGFKEEKLVKFYKATFGLYDLVQPDDISFTRSFDKIFIHPEYADLNNDVMLARLSEPVKFSDYIRPACFIPPIRNTPRYAKNKKCYTVGYGRMEGFEKPVRLQKLQINVKQPHDCNSDKLGLVQLKRGSLCIGPPDNHIGGSCRGDSGGPDLCYDPARDSWFIVGTVSFGPSLCDRETGDKWLTVSADLSNYRTWVLTTILKNS